MASDPAWGHCAKLLEQGCFGLAWTCQTRGFTAQSKVVLPLWRNWELWPQELMVAK